MRNHHNRRVPLRGTLIICLIMALALPAFSWAEPEQKMQIEGSPENRPIFTLRDLNKAFVDIAKTVTPTVVTVSIEKFLTVQEGYPNGFPFMFDPFGGMFGQQGRGQSQTRQYKQSGLGSGVIVSSDGYILTNNHVVAEADSIQVRLFDGRRLPAKVVGRDEQTDVAVIKVNATGLTPIKRGNSDDLQVGEMVMAIGSPLRENLAHTVTQGIVSAKGRQLGARAGSYEDYIQTDAAINPGNSGGALVNLDGEMVGINSAIATQSGGFEGIGFAIPSNMAFRVMDMLVSKGHVVRGYLGITPQDIDEKIASALKVREGEGVLVGDVAEGSPADKAGLQSGDIITMVDGRKMSSASQLRNQISQTPPDTRVALSMLRDGKEQELSVELGELPGQVAVAGSAEAKDLLGFRVSALTRDLASKYGLDQRSQGVVISEIDSTSNAGQAGLQEGDVIRSVNRTRINSLGDFNQAIAGLKKGDSVLLQIFRDGRAWFAPFTL
jgi:serine protease Do